MANPLCLNHILLALSCIILSIFTASPICAQWTLNEALIPRGYSLEVNHRSRYEILHSAFRTGHSGDVGIVAFRTLVHGQMALPLGMITGVELQDSRTAANTSTPLDSTIGNAVELLRAYLQFDRPDTLGGNLTVQAGRMTMDIGSRRFVARNRFRNTINSFTGMDVKWRGAGNLEGYNLRIFWTLPVVRQPQSQVQLQDNKIIFDRENLDLQLWGLFADGKLPFTGHGELYLFGLHEQARPNRNTRNRQLITPGFRLFHEPSRAHFDYQIETALQFGKSSAFTTNAEVLDHFAHFHHLTLGYTFRLPWSPRIALNYDYASGDSNPNDNVNGRFDTLYGARRFEFGPTGIYGAIARANIHSPGLRVEIKPHSQMTSFISYRALWLASDRDAWTASGVIDPDGRPGRFVGSQFEVRLQWQLLPGNIMLESGYAHLFAGEFINNAPNSNRQGDSNFFYTQIAVNF